MPRKPLSSGKLPAKQAPGKSAGASIEQWALERLVPYARNPRRNEHVVGQMVASIKEFGFKIPVLARSDGTVVDGHLRLKAAQFLELKSVPVILCDEWTEAQVKAFRLMANRSVSWADWDEELLGLELEDLKDLEFDLGFTGFAEEEIAKYLNGSTAAAPDGFSEFDESIETEHQCPRCAYRWSGKAAPSVQEEAVAVE
jgi:ParB-like chromosome segregation protein Spo0J